MRIIELDATNWKTVLEFYDALLTAIGAPEWHGKSLGALVDSMIWGEINSVDPPYMVRICGVDSAPADVRERIERASWAIAKGRQDYQLREGRDVEVSIETEP